MLIQFSKYEYFLNLKQHRREIFMSFLPLNHNISCFYFDIFNYWYEEILMYYFKKKKKNYKNLLEKWYLEHIVLSWFYITEKFYKKIYLYM